MLKFIKIDEFLYINLNEINSFEIMTDKKTDQVFLRFYMINEKEFDSFLLPNKEIAMAYFKELFDEQAIG